LSMTGIGFCAKVADAHLINRRKSPTVVRCVEVVRLINIIPTTNENRNYKYRRFDREQP